MLVLGLDISTKTGFCILESSDTGIVKNASGVLRSNKKGFERLASLADKMTDIIADLVFDIIVIEGYGYANKYTLVTLVEVGTVLRYFLWQSNQKYIDVAPNSLKKFVTGKGNAGKAMIIKEVYKRWGLDLFSDDEADAAGLAYFGLALLGVDVGLPKVNLTALSNYHK